MGEEKLSGGIFEREVMMVTCGHCDGDTICKRGGGGHINSWTLVTLSCYACVKATQLPHNSGGYYGIICSVCKGKGNVVL